MAKYHFHVLDGTIAADYEGTDFDKLDDAKCHAVKEASRLICEGADTFWAMRDWQMPVTDSEGYIIFTLLFAGIEATSKRKLVALQEAQEVN